MNLKPPSLGFICFILCFSWVVSDFMDLKGHLAILSLSFSIKHTQTRIFAHKHTHLQELTHNTLTHTLTPTLTHSHTHTNTHTHTHSHTHTHTFKHTSHIHTFTHSHIHMHSHSWARFSPVFEATDFFFINDLIVKRTNFRFWSFNCRHRFQKWLCKGSISKKLRDKKTHCSLFCCQWLKKSEILGSNPRLQFLSSQSNALC